MPTNYGCVRGAIYRAQQLLASDNQSSTSRHTGGKQAVVCDGTLRFPSVKECAAFIECTPATLSGALHDGRTCHGHKVKYEGGRL